MCERERGGEGEGCEGTGERCVCERERGGEGEECEETGERFVCVRERGEVRGQGRGVCVRERGVRGQGRGVCVRERGVRGRSGKDRERWRKREGYDKRGMKGRKKPIN